jgi:hypothetical protein
MMQISRLFATGMIMFGLALSSAARAPGQAIHLKITGGETARMNTPMVASVESAESLKALGVTKRAMLVAKDRAPVLAQLDGNEIRWIEPELKAHEEREYDLTPLKHPTTVPAVAEFAFLDGDGARELVFDDQPIYRYMYKYDPADRENTYKPYHHVFGFHGEGFITKGPGGPESHHRGIFFGFNTQYGNFWADPKAYQKHEEFLAQRQLAGPVAARCASLIDWIGKDGKTVIHDTREVTAWRPKAGMVILDFDVSAESLAGDIKPTGNAHHSGFHFRAVQELQPKTNSLHSGGCTFLRPASAKLLKDDEYSDCPWVAAMFSVKENPYVVMQMDYPQNPKSTFSTRAYGRFGACFTDTLHEKQPMRLRYRFVIMDGKEKPTEAQLAAMYTDFVDPPKVEISK